MSAMILAAGFLGMDTQTWLSIAIGAIVSVVLSVLFYRLQKTPKTLDYAIRSTQDLTAESSPHLRKRMNIIWKVEQRNGPDIEESVRALEEPRIVNYHIRNTGKRAIDAEDFKKPFKIEAGRGSIVDVVVTRVSHPGVLALGPIFDRFELPTCTKSFMPTLMNPRDWIELQVVTDGCPNPPELTSWIREESRPMALRQDILDPPLREVLMRRLGSTSSNIIGNLLGALILRR